MLQRINEPDRNMLGASPWHHDSDSDEDELPSWVRDERQLNSDIATVLTGLDEQEAQDVLVAAGIHVNVAPRTPTSRKLQQSGHFHSERCDEDCDKDQRHEPEAPIETDEQKRRRLALEVAARWALTAASSRHNSNNQEK